MQEQVLGSQHPDLARSLSLLAEHYLCQGYRALAQPLYERALSIGQVALGPEHPDTVALRRALALLARSDNAGE